MLTQAGKKMLGHAAARSSDPSRPSRAARMLTRRGPAGRRAQLGKRTRVRKAFVKGSKVTCAKGRHPRPSRGRHHKAAIPGRSVGRHAVRVNPQATGLDVRRELVGRSLRQHVVEPRRGAALRESAQANP